MRDLCMYNLLYAYIADAKKTYSSAAVAQII